MFSTLYDTYFPFYMHFELSSATCFNSDQSKILLSGNVLILHRYSDTSNNQMMHSLNDTAALVSSSVSVAADDNPVSKQNEIHYENNSRQTNMNAKLCPNKPSKTNEVSIQSAPSYSQENLSQTSDTNSQTCNSLTRGRSRSSRAHARSESVRPLS